MNGRTNGAVLTLKEYLSLPLPLANERLMSRAEVCARLCIDDRQLKNVCLRVGIKGRRGFEFRFNRTAYDRLAKDVECQTATKSKTKQGSNSSGGHGRLFGTSGASSTAKARAMLARMRADAQPPI